MLNDRKEEENLKDVLEKNFDRIWDLISVASDGEATSTFSQFPVAAITGSHKLTGLKHTNLFKFTVLEARSPK